MTLSEVETLFIAISLFNTSLGLTGYSEAQKQADKQKEIYEKLDKIIELLSKEI